MKKIRLGDYCTVSAGGDKPKVFSDIKTSECSVPVFANGIYKECLVGFTNRASIESNSVTLSARGNTGTPFYRTKPYVPIIRLISVIPDKEYINCQYLYYLLKTRNISGTGSVQSQLTVPMVENITVPIIEDLKEQLKIATYLGNIDKKISNNNDISSQLESLAKTIYDYWFLQFDFPDENGRPYKSSGGKMVWNAELNREIPEGWENGNLYDIANFINGIACQKYPPKESVKTLPVIKINEMHNGFSAASDVVSNDIPTDAIIQNGDILFSWSASLEAMIWNGGTGGLNQHIFHVLPKKFPKHYVFEQLAAYIVNFKIMAEARKTTMGHITTDHLKQSKIVLPPISIANAYEQYVRNMFDKVTILKEENLQLTSLRDFLLPLLMNGQVTFEDNI